MKRSISRFFFFTAAVATGALCFGLWSAKVQAVTTGNGPWCPPNTLADHTTTVDMCYQGKTVSAAPSTQTTYLTQKTGTCGACGTSPTP
ncbi:hypothetical protein EV701_107233 [Chthoniobacter flavus]|nr:hypothetical protein [Chthoniobacter flavus]TCO91952.1 hypothetical protein EV701_107233 [Chthoniobacter flavus]